MEILRNRREFLAAASGVKIVRGPFVLQARRRDDCDAKQASPARFGFTVTRRTAPSAVDRNRIKRRLRAAVRGAGDAASPGYDYVLIGRRGALSAGFADILAELRSAMKKANSTIAHRRGGRPDGQ